MPSVPGVRLPVDGAGKIIRTVRPPGYDDGSGGPVEQEVDTLAYQDGSSTDADLQKLRNLDIALSALRTAVSGGKSLADVVQALATVISVSGVVSVSNFPADQLVHANSLPLPTGAARDSTLASLAQDATLGAGNTILEDIDVDIEAVNASLAGVAKDSTVAKDTTVAALLHPGGKVVIDALDVALSSRLKPGDAVQVSNFPPSPTSTLTAQMKSRAPSIGQRLWEDTSVFAAAAAGYWYQAQAPLGDGPTATTFTGIRTPVDASGNIVGKAEENPGPGFQWSTKTGGTWT
jgi:hypothetical protein